MLIRGSGLGPKIFVHKKKDPQITIYWQISGHDTSSDFIVQAAENKPVLNNSLWKTADLTIFGLIVMLN